MAIRYEKDTILNWVNEMGKYLRLLVDRWDSGLRDRTTEDLEEGYSGFFQKERRFFQDASLEEIKQFADGSLEMDQVRYLALLLMRDGLALPHDRNLLMKAKQLLEYHASKTGSFSFEDFGHLDHINKALTEAPEADGGPQ